MSISYPFRLVKIKKCGGYHPFITFFHNEKPYHALIDSGASHSFLNRDYFEDIQKGNPPLLSVGMNSGFSVWETTLEMITLSEIYLPNIVLLKADLSYINRSLTSMGFFPIDGIFGCDLLQQLGATIDFEHHQLFFHDKKQTHLLYFEGDSFFTVTLILNNSPLRLLLDTGASQTLLDLSIAEMLFPNINNWGPNNGATIGISSDDIINANHSMTITFDNSSTDKIPGWEVCFTALKMNKINISYQSASLPPIDAILGLDFLSNVSKIVSFKEKIIGFGF